LIGLVCYVAVKHRDRWLAVLWGFWRALQELWHGLWARGRTETGSEGASNLVPIAPPRPFAAFSDPFLSGRAAQMSLPELVVYSFNGLEAWAEERRCGRRPDETPFEFVEHLVEQVPDLAAEAEQVARLYVQVAYAPTSSVAEWEKPLEEFWSKLTALRNAG
jgi:hypothetical protein